MIGMIRRAIERRRAVRETVERLISQPGGSPWNHAHEQVYYASTDADRAFWLSVLSRIEAIKDRSPRSDLVRRQPSKYSGTRIPDGD